MTTKTQLSYPFTVHAIREIRRRLRDEKEMKRYEMLEGKRLRRGTDVWLATKVGKSASYISELLTIDERARANPRTSTCAPHVARLLDLPLSVYTDNVEIEPVDRAEDAIDDARAAIEEAKELVGDNDEWEVVLRRRKVPHTEEN